MKNKLIIPILLIIFLSLISYINIFKNEFVWDDHVFILDNADIRSIDFKLFFVQDVEGIYRPLRTAHYAVTGKNEFLYHFNSLFFHILISILVFVILFEIFGKKYISLLAALIFAVHPIHTGRVTNITAGFDLFGIFLFLLSYYLYVKFSKLNNKKYLLFSLALFILALFASEEAMILPLIIVLYEFTFNKNLKKFKNYILYFVIAALFITLRFFVLGIIGRNEYLAGNIFLTQLTMLKAYVYYVFLMVFPLNLSLYHDIVPATGILEVKVLLSAVALITLFVFTIKCYKNKFLFFSVFWFFIALIPFSNLLPLQNFMAERYLYVPSIGFSLLLAYSLICIHNIKKIQNKKILAYVTFILAILLLGFYVVKTVDRNDDWRNNLTLWSKTVETNPSNSRAHDNLGFTYERNGQLEEALQEFEKSVALMPGNFRALANLGVVYAKIGRYNESIEALETSLDVRSYHKTFDKLGLVYFELNDEEKAILQFKKAIKIKSRYPKAHNDLGTAYGRLGKFDLALEEFSEAIRIDRDYADAHYNLGVLLEFLGQDDLARKEFREAYRLEPGNELYSERIW